MYTSSLVLSNFTNSGSISIPLMSIIKYIDFIVQDSEILLVYLLDIWTIWPRATHPTDILAKQQ